MNGYVIGLVILIVLVLAASAAASVIWDIDYKRQVSGKRQFRKLEDGKRISHDLRERQPEDPEDRKSTRLNSSHYARSRMPSSA